MVEVSVFAQAKYFTSGPFACLPQPSPAGLLFFEESFWTWRFPLESPQ